jgi:carboxyl-terminal processing protease
MDRIQEDYVDSVSEEGIYTEAARHAVAQLHDPYSDLLVGDDLQAFNDQLAGDDTGGGRLPALAPRTSGALRSLASPAHGHAAPHASAVAGARLVGDGTGYLELRGITEGSADELRAAIDSLRERGMRSLVLDLRYNPGGLIDQGVAIAELFLDPGDTVAVLQGRTRRHSRTYVDDTPQRWPELPLVLLVGRNTASSAELIAGALQDDRRAVVVGGRTYGKGVVQTTYALAPNIAVKLTTARWYTPSGRSVLRPPVDSLASAEERARAAEAGGLVPDLAVRPWTPSYDDGVFLSAIGDYDGFRRLEAGYATRLRAAGLVRDERFVVTPEMRAGLFDALHRDGFLLTRETFDAAATAVDRELGYAIAREAYGPDGELRRRAADDVELQTGRRLLAAAASPAELIRMTRREARRAAER